MSMDYLTKESEEVRQVLSSLDCTFSPYGRLRRTILPPSKANAT